MVRQIPPGHPQPCLVHFKLHVPLWVDPEYSSPIGPGVLLHRVRGMDGFGRISLVEACPPKETSHGVYGLGKGHEKGPN